MDSKYLDSFYSKINIGSDDECWEWAAYTDNDGYGRFSYYHQGKEVCKGAHRISYELRKGPIPKGMCICHKCNNPSCCNPDHLYAGTQKDNWKDMVDSGTATLVKDPSKNPKAKLSWEDVEQIRNSNDTQVNLGKKYGVSQANISAILLNKSWVRGNEINV